MPLTWSAESDEAVNREALAMMPALTPQELDRMVAAVMDWLREHRHWSRQEIESEFHAREMVIAMLAAAKG